MAPGSDAPTRRSAGARSRPGRPPGRAPASSSACWDRPPRRPVRGRMRAPSAMPATRRTTGRRTGASYVCGRSGRPGTDCPQIAAKAVRGDLTAPLPPRRFAVHRARDASRSKPVTQALRASGRSMWQVDESVTGSVNSFWSAKRGSAGAESCRGLSPAFGGGTPLKAAAFGAATAPSRPRAPRRAIRPACHGVPHGSPAPRLGSATDVRIRRRCTCACRASIAASRASSGPS